MNYEQLIFIALFVLVTVVMTLFSHWMQRRRELREDKMSHPAARAFFSPLKRTPITSSAFGKIDERSIQKPTVPSYARGMDILLLGMIGVGIFFLARGAMRDSQPWNVDEWSSVQAIITGRQVRFHDVRASNLQREVSGKYSWFEAHLSYQYSYEGETYVGEDEVMLDDHSHERLNRQQAEARAAERYPVGFGIEVFVQRSNPAISSLFPGADASMDFAIGGSIIAMITVMWFGMRKNSGDSV